MLIEEYLQIRIQSAECILAGEELAGNVPKSMAEKAVIAELRGVEAFLNNASEEEANDSASHNSGSPKCYCCGSENVIIECGSCKERHVFGTWSNEDSQKTQSEKCPKCGEENVGGSPGNINFRCCGDCYHQWDIQQTGA